MSFSDVQHQPQAFGRIRSALTSDRVPHAYVFHGPEGVGRELFANRLARVLLCEQPVAHEAAGLDSCGQCVACEKSAADAHPDLHVVYRELNKQHPDPKVRSRKGLGLSVDVVREFVLKSVASKPAMKRAKVFIIRGAETLNVAAQNSLLKTLEEPPSTTYLLLITTSADRLLETVRSRTQMISFGLLPADFIADRLRAADDTMSEEQAQFCAQHAGGSLGNARRIHEDKLLECDRRLAEALSGLSRRGLTEIAKLVIDEGKALGACYQKRDPEVSDTEAQRRGLKALLALTASALREALHVSVGGVVTINPRYALLAENTSPGSLTAAIRAVATTERYLDFNANVQLTVEGFLIQLNRALAGDTVRV